MVRRSIGYSDALALLGGESPAVAALDRALGGALFVATGGGSALTAGLLGARGEVVRVGHEVVGGLRDRLRGFSRYDRTQRLLAAHAVIAVTAFFEALEDSALPVDPASFWSTGDEQLAFLRTDAAGGAAGSAGGFAEVMLTLPLPLPAPDRPHEAALAELTEYYESLGGRLTTYCQGLAVWDGLDETTRAALTRALRDDLPARALARFEILYRQLALDAPEFAWWRGMHEHQATRSRVDALGRSLVALEDMLRLLAVGSSPDERRSALTRAYRAALDRPILSEGDAPAGVVMPTLEAGYVDPDFRTAAAVADASPASETYWDGIAVRSDLAAFFAAQLTAPAATVAPLLVLGQPGAGKSVLTRILAARLPGDSFLPVRVELREVPADADVPDQIRYAIQTTTGTAMEWPEVARAAGAALPVVLLDGFDELLQATGVSQADYLERVVRFQRREADLGRPVAVVVTSRTAVADRARIPTGTVLLRLEPFRRAQIERWLAVWNRANAGFFASRGIAPLSVSIVERNAELAEQPLLLLLLALYDSDANALQRGAADLDEAELYDRLLHAFAEREVRKMSAGLPDDHLARVVDAELLRLCVVAFAMLNRGRQWVSAAELEADLTVLVGARPAPEVGFRAPLGHGEIALGRFFFVQRSQATRDGLRLATYEFLHATFGEYLVARLTHRVVLDLAAQERAAATAALGAGGCQDGLLYALLSFAPLTVRGPVLSFLRALAGRLSAVDGSRGSGTAPTGVAAAGVAADAAALPVTLFRRLDRRTDDRFRAYEPAPWLSLPSRYGRYGLNLVLLAAVYGGQVRASALEHTGLETIAAWRRHAQLWQAVLSWDEWRSVLGTVRVTREWVDGHRDLVLMLDDRAELFPADPIDMYWSHNHPGWRGADSGYLFGLEVTWQELSRQAALICDRARDVMVQGIEPLLNTIGSLVSTYSGFAPWDRESGEPPPAAAVTMLNALSYLWVAGEGAGAGSGMTVTDRLAAYRHVILPLVNPVLRLDDDARTNGLSLVLHRLAADAADLPVDILAEWVELLAEQNLSASQRRLLDRVVLSALAGNDGPMPDGIRFVVGAWLVDLEPAAFELWIAQHETGRGPQLPVGAEDIARNLDMLASDPVLRRRATWILKAVYGIDPA
jgi:hypothetical protein